LSDWAELLLEDEFGHGEAENSLGL